MICPNLEALEQLETFLQPVIEASERRRLLEEVIQGRFSGLAEGKAPRFTVAARISAFF